MTVRPGDLAPDFEQDTFNGSIRFHEWIGGSWCLLFNTAELDAADQAKPEWTRRGVKLVGVSAHAEGPERPLELSFPVVADTDGAVARLYGNVGAGIAYLIDPDKRIRMVRSYPGNRCDFQEMLELLDRLLRTKDGRP